jgi:hypothetical protein
MQERLRTLADILFICRLEAQQSRIAIPTSVPSGMRSALIDAARQTLANSFQTTLVAAALIPTDDAVLIEIVRCGDCACLVFGPAGNLLMSSPTFGSTEAPDARELRDGQSMRFGPGDELLVKVIERVSPCSQPVQESPTDHVAATNLLVCQPLDQVEKSISNGETDGHCGWLTPKDRLLVPRHLIGAAYEREPGGYCRLRYSRIVRRISNASTAATFAGKGNVTAVLPDHIKSGQWTHLRETVPNNAHVVLCSDGFYTAFADPAELWRWLMSNAAVLDPNNAASGLHELHDRLAAREGDDDMSVVWIRPVGWKESIPNDGRQS